MSQGRPMSQSRDMGHPILFLKGAVEEADSGDYA